MLGQLLEDPRLTPFLRSYAAGEFIFQQGDQSQELYILVEGQVEVLKGATKMAQLHEPGSLFGEMSSLLGARRTATIRALGQVKALCIPRAQVDALIQEFPQIAREVTANLAQRLDEANQAVQGLSEVCDQLPDAVVFTDQEGKICAFNAAAQALYGQPWPEVRGQSAQDIYADPEAFQRLIEEVRTQKQVREAVLAVKHPTKGRLLISTSLNALYDIQQNFEGVLSVGRDVTTAEGLKKTVRRLRNWVVPVMLLCAALVGAAFYGVPILRPAGQVLNAPQQDLRNHLAKDYLALKSLLLEPLASRNRAAALHGLHEFCRLQDPAALPYLGLVLLDRDKEVFAALSTQGKELDQDSVGSTYAHLRFQGDERSLHRVVALYRQNQQHAMGRKGLELAFELKKGAQMVGWLVFQMDVEGLSKRFGLDEEGLKNLSFSGAEGVR